MKETTRSWGVRNPNCGHWPWEVTTRLASNALFLLLYVDISKGRMPRKLAVFRLIISIEPCIFAIKIFAGFLKNVRWRKHVGAIISEIEWVAPPMNEKWRRDSKGNSTKNGIVLGYTKNLQYSSPSWSHLKFAQHSNPDNEIPWCWLVHRDP